MRYSVLSTARESYVRGIWCAVEAPVSEAQRGVSARSARITCIVRFKGLRRAYVSETPIAEKGRGTSEMPRTVAPQYLRCSSLKSNGSLPRSVLWITLPKCGECHCLVPVSEGGGGGGGAQPREIT